MHSTIKYLIDHYLDRKKRIRNSLLFKNLESRISTTFGIAGVSPPWKRNERTYWCSRYMGEQHGPENYLQEDNSTYVMFEGLLKTLGQNASFLEVGCNAGRNLNYLLKHGYTDLAGIEINDASINVVLKEHFSELYEKGNFFVGNALDEIKKIPDERYDVVFSIGVFEHIPYEDKALFKEVARVSKRYVAIITSVRSRLFNYNYEKIFRNLGFTTIEYRLFYGENHNFSVSVEPYDAKKHAFDSKFLRIFIKNRKEG